ncbi:hypothetical protein [Paenibacillus agri]|nr:hypothetical protein [Paenibacillus agri]
MLPVQARPASQSWPASKARASLIALRLAQALQSAASDIRGST